MTNPTLENNRSFLKDTLRLSLDFSQTDQNQGVPPPPIEKPFDPGRQHIRLPPRDEWKTIGKVDVASAIWERSSHRQFKPEALSLEELAFLLWATQGIRKKGGPGRVFRTVPSAGCRHALETYVCALNVSGLEVGLYRYLPLEHQLLVERRQADMGDHLIAATLGQIFAGRAAATFVWSTIPYRMEWRYDLAAHKVIALDAGHVCQNLYLACAAIEAGTCAIGAYNQKLMDELLGVDGQEEFTVYLAPVGKI